MSIPSHQWSPPTRGGARILPELIRKAEEEGREVVAKMPGGMTVLGKPTKPSTSTALVPVKPAMGAAPKPAAQVGAPSQALAKPAAGGGGMMKPPAGGGGGMMKPPAPGAMASAPKPGPMAKPPEKPPGETPPEKPGANPPPKKPEGPTFKTQNMQGPSPMDWFHYGQSQGQMTTQAGAAPSIVAAHTGRALGAVQGALSRTPGASQESLRQQREAAQQRQLMQTRQAGAAGGVVTQSNKSLDGTPPVRGGIRRQAHE